jgi:tetratricopeptide (TPR) repeat protein
MASSSSSSQPAPPAPPPPPLSEYSLEPYPAEEVARFKHVLETYKFDGCSPVELSDAYESLGLSQLLNGDYAEAATHLECACTIQEDTLKTATDANVDHRHATKFWCGVAFMRVGQLDKAEAVFSHLLAHIQKKRSELFVAANSNMALLLVQLNKRRDLAVKHASAAVQVGTATTLPYRFHAGLDGRQTRNTAPRFPPLHLLYAAAPIQAASRMYKPHAPELLAPRRVLLHVLLHFGEYSHAEVVVDEARGMAPLEQVRRALLPPYLGLYLSSSSPYL